MERSERESSRWTQTTLVVLVVVALAAAWRLLLPAELAPLRDERGAAGEADVSAHADSATADRRAAESAAGADRTLEAASDAPVVTANVLRVRLTGLDVDVPWTAPMQLHLEAQDRSAFAFLLHDDKQKPDPEGCCSFELPGWWSRNTDHQWRLRARDEKYREVDLAGDGAFDASDELVLQVQPIRSLVGRVVDASGSVVAFTSVRVFAMDRGEPESEPVANTHTNPEGTWRAEIPSSGTFVLIAEPVEVSDADDDHDYSFEDLDVEPGERSFPEPEPQPRPRTSRLPASVVVTTGRSASTTAPDLVLQPGFDLHGVVRWANGAPAVGVTVRDVASAIARLAIYAVATTDETGGFTIDVPALAVTQLAIGDSDALVVLGPLLSQTVDPSRPIAITLPEPVRVTAVLAGRPVDATFEVAGQPPREFAPRSSLRAIATAPQRIRAVLGEHRAAWCTIGPADRGKAIDLDLGAITAQPLELEFDDALRVTSVRVEWTEPGGTTGSKNVTRESLNKPLRVLLEPGNHRLRIAPVGSLGSSRFLVPLERQVAIGAAPVRLELPATRGGTFAVVVTDRHGSRAGCTCTVRDAKGADVSGPFERTERWWRSESGARDVAATGSNRFARCLPAGEYELVIDAAGHPTHHERITIREGEVTDVRVRL